MSVRLLGHRGARARAPENTMISLRRALDDGAEGFEFDVRMTKDGVAVLLHDETLERTTSARGPLAGHEHADLASVDAGGGEPVPTLTDVLDRYLGEVTLALEMKEVLSSEILCELAVRLETSDGSRLILASFLPPALQRATEHLPEVRRALILGRGQPVPSPEQRRALGLWGVFARTESVDPRFVGRCGDDDLALFAYTVNEPDDAARLAKLGVDGIISDDPGAVRSALS